MSDTSIDRPLGDPPQESGKTERSGERYSSSSRRSSRERREFTGKKKAAIFFVAIGAELAARIFSYLNEQEIESISYEIARLDNIDYQLKQQILKEFYDLYSAKRFMTHGGSNLAKEMLVKALGVEKAEEIIHNVSHTNPLDTIKHVDPNHLLNFIQNEHPQTIALILAHINPEHASLILSKLDSNIRSDVAKRIAEMDRISPEVLRSVGQVLNSKISSFSSESYTASGGIESIVDILNNADRSTEKSIIENLEEEDPELAEEIKQRMFVFEDIVMLDNQAVQQVLHEIDSLELARALKAASPEVREKIFSNMSKRAEVLLQEEMEYLGPIRIKDVEDSQRKIVSIIRRLEDQGDIVIARAGGDEIIV